MIQCRAEGRLHLLQGDKQGPNTAGAKVQGRQGQTIVQYYHNVLPAKRGGVLPDGFNLREWDGVYGVHGPVCMATSHSVGFLPLLSPSSFEHVMQLVHDFRGDRDSSSRLCAICRLWGTLPAASDSVQFPDCGDQSMQIRKVQMAEAMQHRLCVTKSTVQRDTQGRAQRCCVSRSAKFATADVRSGRMYPKGQAG